MEVKHQLGLKLNCNWHNHQILLVSFDPWNYSVVFSALSTFATSFAHPQAV